MVDRLAIAHRRLELNRLGNAPCFLIQSVAQPTDHTENLDLATCQEADLQRDFALNSCGLSIGRVVRTRL